MSNARSAFITIACFAAIPVLFTPSARAECDISQTKCAVNGGKCNIKFRNLTGVERGSGKDTSINQTAEAKLIRVKAVKKNGKKLGNALSINASRSKTLNIDKKAKKDFDRIQITSPDHSNYRLGYTCSGDHVVNPER